MYTETDIEGLQAALRLFYTDISRRYSVIQLAMEAGMSTTKFQVAFKWYTGRSVFLFEHTYRLNAAYDWVCFSRLSIPKISGMTGYRFMTHFNAAFAKRFLISPYALRVDRK